MAKNALPERQEMTEAVADARRMAADLLAREHRGPGDTVEAAMHRAAQRYGIDVGTFWALRYRPPKDMLVSVWLRLKAVHEHEIERQERRLRHELEITKALGRTAANSAAVRAAEALLGPPDDTHRGERAPDAAEPARRLSGGEGEG